MGCKSERESGMNDLLLVGYRSNSALRGQITRLKKRIVRGCCPFCNQGKVSNLTKHVVLHHPNMVKKYGVKQKGQDD